MKRNLLLPIFAVVVVVAMLAATVRPARAEIGIGLFVGQPTGLDIKLDLQRKTALDIVAGWKYFDDDGRDPYGHLTFLVNLTNARGRDVVVPFRLGIGGAVWDAGSGDDVNIAVRAPFEVGIRFRRTPLEIYGEVALVLVLIDENDNDDNIDADGGIGLRVYF